MINPSQVAIQINTAINQMAILLEQKDLEIQSLQKQLKDSLERKKK